MQVQNISKKNQRVVAFYFVIVTLVLLVVLSMISILVGAKSITLGTIVSSFLEYDSTNSQHVIIQTIRLPRIIVALCVGASFAVSGALMQATTRNPMASPSVLGINAGAGLGLAVAMVVVPAATLNITILYSFAGAAVSTIAIYSIAALSKAGASPVTLALVGTAISAAFGALSQAIAVFYNISQDLTFWKVGGISGIRMSQALLLLPWTILGIVIALLISKTVTLLTLGEDVAIGLGGKTTYIRFISLIVVLILTGSSVAIVGPISFVGLVIPHVVRSIVGVDYRRVLPCSMLAGSLLVLGADIISRLVNPPYETPVGAITAIIGVPFFIYLATTKKEKNR